MHPDSDRLLGSAAQEEIVEEIVKKRRDRKEEGPGGDRPLFLLFPEPQTGKRFIQLLGAVFSIWYFNISVFLALFHTEMTPG